VTEQDHQRRSLTRREIALVERRVRELLGRDVVEFAESRGISLRDSVRFGALSEQCVAARQRKGLTLKQAAAQIRVPQYRLREIEHNHLSHIDPSVLQRYLGSLGLESEAAAWSRQHRSLARRLGLLAPSARSAPSKHRTSSAHSSSASRRGSPSS
jgi:transcriptional regulator with XRE-family HTH domain